MKKPRCAAGLEVCGWCVLYESGVLNSSGDFAVVEESISNDGDASSGDIGSDPSHGEAKATTSSSLEFLIVDGLEVGELVGHWNELVRGKWRRGSVLPPRLLQDPSCCGDEQKRLW